VFHKNNRYFQLPSVGHYICILGLALTSFDLSLCHQLMDHAASMSGTSVQHKVHLHNLHGCDYIEAKENERKWLMTS